jgi:hypothetical protein
MKTFKTVLSITLLLSCLSFYSCKKKKTKPFEDCFFAILDEKNLLEGKNFSRNLSSCDKSTFNTSYQSLTASSGSYVKIIFGWCFDGYKDEHLQLSKVYIKTVVDGKESECEIKENTGASIGGYAGEGDYIFPAYSNAKYYVRFVASNGEEHTVGPLNLTINQSNNLVSTKSFESYSSVNGPVLINTNVDANKLSYYLFAPTVGEIGSEPTSCIFKGQLNNSFSENRNRGFSPQFGLFCLTKDGVGANQVKLVAANKIAEKGLYPELVNRYGCDLGLFYAKFEYWPVSLDTATHGSVYTAFDEYVKNFTYNNLDTLSFSNPQTELVVSKSQPTFKFITSYGKKGVAAIEIRENESNIAFKMQR